VFDLLKTRLRQGTRTITFPAAPPVLPDRFRGLPVLDPARCPEGCDRCVAACPTQAISQEEPGQSAALQLDLGRCLFCTDCTRACPTGAVSLSRDYRLATRQRADLVLRSVVPGSHGAGPGALDEHGLDEHGLVLAEALQGKIKSLFGRSLKLRQVSAGGCNGCESDINVLGTIGFDLGRFGIQIVASPRHADGLLVTGPVTQNMSLALRKTWDAVPAPKLVIAVGACAISGGPFRDHPEVQSGIGDALPVDLFIAGCPPHPITILDGLLRLLGRVEAGQRQAPGAGPGAAALETEPGGA